MTLAEGAKQGAEPSPLADAFGLTDDDMAMLEALFVESASNLGVDGQRVFEQIKRGQSLGGALAIPSGVIELLYARAHKWFAVGRPDIAEGLFRALCVLDGSCADYWVGYGICLRQRSAFDEAVTALETAARLKPDWEIPRFHALELFMRREQWQRAATALTEFDARARAEPALPPIIVAQAERFRTALKLRELRAPAEGSAP
jgi:tetratricopeptide (TPR) repeat protein